MCDMRFARVIFRCDVREAIGRSDLALRGDKCEGHFAICDVREAKGRSENVMYARKICDNRDKYARNGARIGVK